ncbi:MAG TPA: hypothetical protein VIL66_04995 [Bacillota bacterium]
MGKVIPFPGKKRIASTPEGSGELTDALIREKILAGEAELVGEFNEEGCPCTCYRLKFDNQTYYIFDLSSLQK